MIDVDGILLTSDQRGIVESIVAARLPHREVRVFGSRARGPIKRHSDLDLLVLGMSRLDLSTRAELNDDFDESDLPFRVDVVDANAIDPSFLARVLPGSVLLRLATQPSPTPPHPA